jgi:thiol-disulfide isomerase/thioredoxin
MKAIYFLLFLCIIALIRADDSAQHDHDHDHDHDDAEHQDDTNLHELNETSLPEFLTTKHYAFVKFYTPDDCPACHKLNPHYTKSAEGAKPLGVSFIKVDASANVNLAKEWGVSDYPAVFWVNNKEGIREQLKSHDNLLSFARRMLGVTKIQKVNSLDELASKNFNTTFIIVGVDDVDTVEQDKIYLLEGAAEKAGINTVVLTGAKDVKDKYNVDGHFKVAVSRWDKKSNAFEESENIDLVHNDYSDEESLAKVLDFYRTKGYQVVDEDLMNIIIEEGKPSVMLIHGEETSQHDINKIDEVLRDLSHTYRKELFFSRSEHSNSAISIINEVLGVKTNHLPYLLLTHARANTAEDMDKFKLEKVNIDKTVIQNFIDQWKHGELKSFLVTEDLPERNPDERGVYKVVGQNFNEFLTQRNKDIVLHVCTPEQKACTKFAERFNRIVEKLAGNSNLVIGETDPNLNEYEVEFVQKFPNLLFFPSENDGVDVKQKFANVVVYDGDLTTAKVSEWIIQNAKNDIKVKQLDNEDEINEKEASEPIKPAANQALNFEDMFKGADGNMDLAKLFAALGGGAGGNMGMGEMPNFGGHDDHEGHEGNRADL